MAKRLFLVDGSSYFFRAYHALPPMSTRTGIPTNASLGFTNMLLKILEDYSPEYVAVIFDPKGPTFRNELYEDYKANRSEMPADLEAQFPYIQKILKAFQISLLVKEGVEADDVIGTLVKRYRGEVDKIVIVSGDKDFMQLIGDSVVMLDTMKGKEFDRDAVIERFGVGPELVADLMALVGDSSDNIPGVEGVGLKTASKLINEFGSLQGVLDHVDEISGEKRRKNLTEQADLAHLSKKLFLIDVDLELDVELEDFSRLPYDRTALIKTLKELEFFPLIKRLSLREGGMSQQNFGSRETLYNISTLEDYCRAVEAVGRLSVDTETTSVDALGARLVGISLSIPEQEKLRSAYIPITHRESEQDQLELRVVSERLGPVLSNPFIQKICQNAKYDMLVLQNHGMFVKGLVSDTMIASYLLNPEGRHNLDDLALEHLDHETTTFSELVPKGETIDQVSIGQVSDYACEDVEVTFRLSEIFEKALKEEGLWDLFVDVEVPLVEVLTDMEVKGMKIDVPCLNRMSEELGREIEALEKKIYGIAGEDFNIKSSQQLAVILFEKLRLPPLKKTKTGYSTNADVLQQLADQHELPAVVLEYRELTKLKSTYVDPLPTLVNPKTGRVHTSYSQTTAATGRLASRNPNLQNIPLRGERGRQIREAFVAEKGGLLISADYSQIELRVLAHLSEDPSLVEAFKQGEDIHSWTASHLFEVSNDQVTSEMRRTAKTINFGILYGMSAHRLSRELNISMKEAKSFMDQYFNRFSGIRAYLDGTIQKAQTDRCVTTLLNRRRYLPDINSPNGQLRMASERIAMNMPIQGTAADIIKVAMVKMHRRLQNESLPASIILQVHDELIVEAEEEEAEKIADILRQEMERAISLRVPVKVDVRVGSNWMEISH